MRVHALYCYYKNKSRSKMRSVIIPLLPAKKATMKSGKGFHETFSQVFVDAFWKELMQTKGISVKEANQVLPPLLLGVQEASMVLWIVCQNL